MTVLITGAGLIGSLAADALARQGRRVILSDIRPPASNAGAGITRVQCDVANIDALDALVEKFSITEIVHTAAVLSTGMRANPGAGLATNFLGITNVLEIARLRQIKRVVNASSLTVLYPGFGTLPEQPIDEDIALKLVSQRPSSLYAISKLTSEQLGLHYRDTYGLSTVSLRFAAVLGGSLTNPTSVPGQLMKVLCEAARASGTAVLDDPLLTWAGTEEFIDARDCAEAIVHALAAERPTTGVYNITSTPAVTLEQFIAAVQQAIGPFKVEMSHRPDKGFAGFPFVRPAPSSTVRARDELGFIPQHRLADTIQYWSAR
ncbi:MAG: NAD-dependent epimerase/dehydratase family protein [Rhodopseudomonas sp.]|nr:NAD-dependent epimerase/dehydratase family protein [Rhodopseudomonas sp.]